MSEKNERKTISLIPLSPEKKKNTLNERPPEIGANPALYYNLCKSYPSSGPTNHRKRAEKGLFLCCRLAQQRWQPLQIKFMYACL